MSASRGKSRKKTAKTARKKAPARSSAAAKRKAKQRVGTLRRQVILAVAALTIPTGLLISIRRSAEGTRLAEGLGVLRRETRLLDESLVEEILRVDSLTSRERVGGLAVELGLRQATDDEVVILSDDPASRVGRSEGS